MNVASRAYPEDSTAHPVRENKSKKRTWRVMEPVLRLGDSVFSRINTSADFTRLLKDNLPDSDSLIVKADWVGIEEGSAMNLETLRCIVDAAQGRVIVTEGHLLHRSMELEPKGLKFIADGEEVDWDWLINNNMGWRWLIRNPDWGWFIEGPHWKHIMKEEKHFLGKYGYLDFFKENGVEYVNATDEVWAGKVADERIVRETVESRFPPVFTDKLYGIVPARLFKYRGAPLISQSKRKDYQSFTMKNLFGLIPDPVRAWWHGGRTRQGTEARLDKSILDMNKIYGALFEVVGVFEAPHSDGSNPFTRDVGISAGIAQLDAILSRVTGYEQEKTAYISSGNSMFGFFDNGLLKKAESQLSGWFPAPKEKAFFSKA